MIKDNSVVIFTNSRIEADDDAVWTTEAVQEFLAKICERRNVILASVKMERNPDSRHNSATKLTSSFQLCSLGRASFHGSYFWKAFGYVKAFLRIMFKVPKKPFWYIFAWGHMATLACMVCCLLGRRYGIYVRNEWPTYGVTGLLYRWYFKRAAFIFTTGKTYTDALRKYNNNVEEVAPMVRFSTKDLQEKPSYEVNDRARILYVGAVDPTKGVIEAVQALPYVAKQCDVELKIVGSGINPEFTRTLQAEIQTGGCADNIEMVGHVGNKQELAKWYTSADVFAFPTYYKEGFPRVIYEAMGFGLPVICTDIEGGRQFLRNNDNCRIVKKKDVKDLANGLIELILDQTLRTSLGNRAFHDAKELFTRFEGDSHGSQLEKAICQLQRND